MGTPDVPGSDGNIPAHLTTPNISLAERLKVRAENIEVLIQEIFPLKAFQQLVEDKYIDFQAGKIVNITFSSIPGVDIESIKSQFPNMSETQIADRIASFLSRQGYFDEMRYDWHDTHTLSSAYITCTIGN